MDAPTTAPRRLCTRVLEVRDELLALLGLLDAGKHHFGSFNILLRREQVVEERVLAPDDATVLVRVAERVAGRLAGLPPKDAVQVRALLVRAAGLDGVALTAFRLENFGSFCGHLAYETVMTRSARRRRRGV